MNLVQPYYIDKRQGSSHISLDGQWDFTWEDVPKENVQALTFSHKTEIPSSAYHSLHKAGVLPDPYVGTNSKLYHWVDEKVWYYRKTFCVDKTQTFAHAYLCFEGISYYARVWINGRLLGSHTGMFGGPVVDVAEFLLEENEIIVEAKACNFGKKDTFDPWNFSGENSEIVPWNIARDTQTSNGDFIVVGLWNRVRIELLPEMHISRPYLYTESIGKAEAKLQLELEIADGMIEELHRFYGMEDYDCYTYTRAYDSGLTGSVRKESVEIGIGIYDGEECVYESFEEVPLTDFESLGMDKTYHELQFYRKSITVKNPKLWYPNGLGEAFLYDVRITMSYDDRVVDSHRIPFGIRTFTADYTHGNKYRNRWDKYLFSINGQEFFLKGMNWIQMDFLYDISPERYVWCLHMAKNAGIQLIRVWNGGGMPETDTFYELCDQLGIMVWQDQFVTNTLGTKNFPHKVLEAQIAYNLYRTRNHPSLVVLCGGNEFNPYVSENAAAMFVTQRTAEMLAPDRVYYSTTADKGSAHIYIDMEPNWYRHRYKQLPFLGESGIHSFPKYKTIKQFIRGEETVSALPDLSSSEFPEQYPELLNHFSEYIPERVPRMTARISQITDMKNITLEELCEASQVQAYEFYQLMIDAMQENYPTCGGIMPWVFKRPWPTAGVQTVDGDDRPGYAYYAVQNAYRPLHIIWCQQWSVIAPKEEIPLQVKVFNQNGEDILDCEICFTIYHPDLTVWKEYTEKAAPDVSFGTVTLDETFTDTCFLVCVELTKGKKVLSRSVYPNKCTKKLTGALLEAYRTAPKENLRLDDGPWLMPQIASANQAALSATVTETGFDDTYHYADICMKNISDTPAYPVTVDTDNDTQRCYVSDNFFLLKPGEEKTVRITCDSGEPQNLVVDFWNGEKIKL